ncbi:hypothetical protein CMI37_31085 [Candidatus Pacearchaeota archaeon]|nr:hypothetical protein [Candidatus Pacearchaeota archaeon]|tara:strand:+ start:3594 stop:3788 length:195 start_codon:yes stop_codon:yes gene_type:complete
MNQEDLVRKVPKKIMDAMKAIAVGNKGKPIIMEVIGRNGQKISEYVDKPDSKPPYMILKESYTL